MVPLYRPAGVEPHGLLPARRDGSYRYSMQKMAERASPCTQGWFFITKMALKIEEGLLPARRDGSLSIFISGAEVRAYPCTQGWFLAEIFCRARFSGFSLHAGMVPWRLSWTKSHWLLPARRDGSRQEIFVVALD